MSLHLGVVEASCLMTSLSPTADIVALVLASTVLPYMLFYLAAGAASLQNRLLQNADLAACRTDFRNPHGRHANRTFCGHALTAVFDPEQTYVTSARRGLATLRWIPARSQPL